MSIELSGSWLPGNREKIMQMIAAAQDSVRAPLAVFDLDQTCIKGDIGYAFFYQMVENILFKHRFKPFRQTFLEYNMGGYAEKLLIFLDEARGDEAALGRDDFILLFNDLYSAVRDELGDRDLFRWMAGLFLGWHHDDVRKEAERLLHRELIEPLSIKILAADEYRQWEIPTGIRVYREIHQLISVLQEYGFDVWIISATSQPIVEAAGDFLGVPRRKCIGVRFVVKDGVLVSLAETVTYREGKVEAIKKFIGKMPVFVAGDSYTDWEMLDYCDGVSLLLDRGKQDLVEYGKEHGWLIQPLFETDY